MVFPRSGLFLKILWVVVPILVALMGVGGTLALVSTERALLVEKEQEVRDFARTLSRIAAFHLARYSYYALEDYVASLQESGGGARVSVEIRDAQGRLVNANAADWTLWGVPSDRLRAATEYCDLNHGDETQRLGSVRVVYSFQSVYRTLEGVRGQLFVVFLIMGLFVIAGVLWTLWRQVLVPLRALGWATNQVAQGQFLHAIPVSRGTELGDLADAVEAMGRELETLFLQAQEQTREIDRARADLETKVQERTAELETKNQELLTVITHLEQTQAYLVESEKFTGLGRLVAGVAHEINTPLGNAVSMATFLQEVTQRLGERSAAGSLSREGFREALRTLDEGYPLLVSNLARAADLVTSFKQLSADHVVEQPRMFSWDQCVEEVFTSLQHHFRPTKLKLVSKAEESIVLLSIPGIWIQILSNLILNAQIHAFDPGAPGRILVRAHSGKKFFVVRVEDDGKGISSENLAKIFEPFFTTRRHEGGTGLGLSIVHSLVVQRLNGRIQCTSKIGKGTKFEIKVPHMKAVS